MQIISTHMGFIISFQNVGEFEAHLKNMNEYLENVKEEGPEPPYLYAVFDGNIEKERVKAMLQVMKKKG